MSDSKTNYSITASKTKKISELNKSLFKKLQGGESRSKKYNSGWQNVNLNDLVKRFVPGAIAYESGGKILFSNEGRYIIVADAAGGYCRIQDLQNHSKNPYVTLDGKPYGELPANERERLTHFRIMKREEM